MLNKKLYITLIVSVSMVLAGSLLYFILKDYGNRNNGSNSQNATTSVHTTAGVSTVGDGKYTVEQLPLANGQKSITFPNLDRPVNVPSSFDAASKKIILDKIMSTITTLKQNPKQTDPWLNLAIYRKMIGDYEGAVQIWEFLGNLDPKNYVTFSNLGDVYGFYLKNPTKAEANFKIALQNGANESTYRSFGEFYWYVLGDKAKAKTIFEEAIAKYPGDASKDIQVLLDRLNAS